MVRLERFERFAQAAADRGHVRQFGGRQIVEVLVHGFARMDLVLDPVEPGHEQCRIGQVRVSHRIGEAEFHALGLVARTIGDAAGGRTVARRIGEQDGRLEARYQSLVAVGGRVGEGVQRLGVLDDTADVVQAVFAEATILVAREGRLAAVPDRHVRVHAGPVVVLDRLGHEGRGLAVDMGDLLHDILVDLQIVGGFDERSEGHAQLVLSGGDFVVMLVAGQAHLDHGRDHFAADIDCAVDRGHGEIPALGARTVRQIAALIFLAGVGRQLDVVDGIARTGIAILEPDIVEHEEFGFHADVDRVAQAGALDEGFGALGGGPRVACV